MGKWTRFTDQHESYKRHDEKRREKRNDGRRGDDYR
jgi:hypothetical protein